MRRFSSIALLLSVLTLLLPGCAVWQNSQDKQAQAIMPIAKPIGPSRRVVQQLTANWADRQEALLVILELDARRIAMSGLSNDGMSLFNWRYDGEKVQADKSALLPDAVDPRYMIADLQLTYWPADVLQNALPSGWRLEVTGHKRILYFNNVKQTEVNYVEPDADWPKAVELINHQYHYRLQIRTLSYDLIPE